MMKINFLGDSITEGALATSQDKTFVSFVGKYLNCEARNYGIGGTRIARQKTPTADPRWDLDFVGRVDAMNPDADLVFVFGGTNDYGHGDAPMGNINDSTVYSFCGAINVLIDELEKKYGKEKLVFITPLYRENENNPYGDGNALTPRPPLSEYRKAMVEVLTNRKITILDLKDEMGRPEGNPLIADGLHPNDEGHKKIAVLISNFIKNHF